MAESVLNWVDRFINQPHPKLDAFDARQEEIADRKRAFDTAMRYAMRQARIDALWGSRQTVRDSKGVMRFPASGFNDDDTESFLKLAEQGDHTFQPLHRAIYRKTFENYKKHRPLWQRAEQLVGQFGEGELGVERISGFVRSVKAQDTGTSDNDFQLFKAFVADLAGRKATQTRGTGERITESMRRGILGADISLNEIWNTYNPVSFFFDPARSEKIEAFRGSRELADAIRAVDPVISDEDGRLMVGVLDAAGMAPDMVAGGAAAMVGGPAAGVAYWTARLQPETLAQLRAQGVSESTAQPAALIMALGMARVEMIGRLRPDTAKFIAAIKEGGIKKFLSTFSLDYVKQFGKENAEEWIQKAIELVGRDLTPYIERQLAEAGLLDESKALGIDWGQEMERSREELLERVPLAILLLMAPGKSLEFAAGGAQAVRESIKKTITEELTGLAPDEFVEQFPDKAEALAEKGSASRRAMSAVGVTQDTSAEQRQGFVKEVADVINESARRIDKARGVAHPRQPQRRIRLTASGQITDAQLAQAEEISNKFGGRRPTRREIRAGVEGITSQEQAGDLIDVLGQEIDFEARIKTRVEQRVQRQRVEREGRAADAEVLAEQEQALLDEQDIPPEEFEAQAATSPEPQPFVEQAEPAPAQPRQETRLPDLTTAELEQELQGAKAEDANVLIELFGDEGATKFRNLERRANSTTRPDSETDAAQAEIDAIVEGLSEPQQRMLFGQESRFALPEDVDAILRARADEISPVQREGDILAGQLPGGLPQEQPQGVPAQPQTAQGQVLRGEPTTTPEGEAQQIEPLSSEVGQALFVQSPAESASGSKLLKRLGKDAERKKGHRVGFRSIVEFVNELAQTKLIVGRSQTTGRKPAHFAAIPHIVRSRSGGWQLNFHEAGHAISHYLQDRQTGWSARMKQDLIALTQVEGSMASSKSAEEGMAEMTRRFIADYNSLPAGLVRDFENALQGTAPEVLSGLRDAHRAYVFQRSRPIGQQMATISNDKAPPPSKGQAASDLVYRGLWHLVGGSTVMHKIWRRTFGGITQEGPLSKIDPTGLIGLSRQGFDKQYRDMLKLAREFRKHVNDSPADINTAYQSTIQIPGEVQRALYGARGQREGIRVLATGKTFGGLSEPDVELLRQGGFHIPDKLPGHGEWLYLSDQSLEKIKRTVGINDWHTFQMYGQYRAALERFKRKGHRYPGLSDGLTPDVLEKFIKQQDKAHPDWKERFRDISRYMDSLLLVATLSGEFTAEEAVRIRQSQEDYWPLPRQLEDRPQRTSGGGAEPTAGVRSAFGSDLPFRSLDEAVEVRTKQAMESFYTNRLMLALHRFSEEAGSLKGAPFGARKDALRLMLPLRLESKRAITMTEQEQRELIAEAMNRQAAEQMGIPFEQLGGGVTADSITISFPGRPLWRSRKPDAVHIVAPFIDGRRQYFQITDPGLFDLLTASKNPARLVKFITDLIGGPVRPWKRSLTQNWAFGAFNVSLRDPITAFFQGTFGKQLIPGYVAAVGLIHRIRGTTPPDAKIQTELLSKAFDHTTRDAHQTLVESFMNMLGEGIVTPGYSDMSLADKTALAPGQAMSTLMKPVDTFNFLSGGRWFAQFTETLSREGAFIIAQRNGASVERAQFDYANSTGNFGQRQGNPNAAAFVRIAGFVNPGVQIMWSQAAKVTDPDPAQRAQSTILKLPILAGWAAVLAAMNVLLMRLTHDDDEFEDIVNLMKERTDEDRYGFVSINGRIRLPFDHGVLGAIFSYGYNSTEQWLLDIPADSENRARILMRRALTLPGITDIIPPHVKTFVELKLNHSFFYDKEIVPSYLEQQWPYNPDLQAFDNTPKLYRDIAKSLNVSPIKVKYATRQIFTAIVDDAISFISRGGEIPEGADAPVIGRLLQREPRGFNSQAVKSLRELDQKYQAANAVLKELTESPNSSADEISAALAARGKLATAHDFTLDVMDQWKLVRKERLKEKPDKAKVKQLEREMTKRARRFIGWHLSSRTEPEPVPERRERDLFARAVVLSNPRSRSRKTRANQAEKMREARLWLKERNISRAKVIEAFRKLSRTKYKLFVTVADRTGRLRRALAKRR